MIRVPTTSMWTRILKAIKELINKETTSFSRTDTKNHVYSKKRVANSRSSYEPVNEADICVHKIVIHIVKIMQRYTAEKRNFIAKSDTN